MEEEYKYVLDNNGLLANEDAFSLDKKEHLERKIYLFVNVNKPGLSFPDLSSFSLINDYPHHEEKFITQKELICEVQWDNTINYPNKIIKLDMSDGMMIARTIMISKKKMNNIKNLIKKSSDTENIEINLKND